MNNMKKLLRLIVLGIVLGLFYQCKNLRRTQNNKITSGSSLLVKASDTVIIANDSIDYEIIIIDPGFTGWLNSTARPRSYYSQGYLERRNAIYVVHWNQRVMDSRFNRDLYLMTIDYNPQIDYGYEVNYLLFNYFLFFQREYNQQLGSLRPRLQ